MNRGVFPAFLALSTWCSTCCPAAAADGPSSDGAPKKIVLIAGPKDHGGPGAYEYEKDLVLLKKCLETSPNVRGVSAEVHVFPGT